MVLENGLSSKGASSRHKDVGTYRKGSTALCVHFAGSHWALACSFLSCNSLFHLWSCIRSSMAFPLFAIVFTAGYMPATLLALKLPASTSRLFTSHSCISSVSHHLVATAGQVFTCGPILRPTPGLLIPPFIRIIFIDRWSEFPQVSQ